MRSHGEFRTPGVISVFIGRHRSESKMLDYLKGEFHEKDFDFVIDPRGAPEYDVQPREVPISLLVKDFSFYKGFHEGVVKEAQAQGFSKASALVIFYNFRFDPSVTRSEKPRLQFLGVFDYEGRKQ